MPVIILFHLLRRNLNVYIAVPPSSHRFICNHIKNCTFYVGGLPLDLVESFARLGYNITNKLLDNVDFIWTDAITSSDKSIAFYVSITSWMQVLDTSCFSLNVWVLMVVSYGHSQTIRLMTWCISLLKSLRRIFGLPWDTLCYILPLLGQCLSHIWRIRSHSFNRF